MLYNICKLHGVNFALPLYVSKFYIVVLLPILNHSCLSAVVPIVPVIVTLIVNTLQFLNSNFNFTFAVLNLH